MEAPRDLPWQPRVPIDDSALLLGVDRLKAWDPSRFHTCATLQKCPRNQGEVLLVEDATTGRRLTVKRMPLQWVCRDAAEFAVTHPGETEVPWMDMGATKYLNSTGFGYCVEFVGVYLDGDHVAFLMGFAEGGDLFSYLESADGFTPGPNNEALLRPLVVELFGAVGQLHALGIAHRDLSLENVLLSGSRAGPVRIIDFGMATARRMQQGPACGKPSYIAPEVHIGGGYDAFQADSFSCGVMLYQLLVRDYPWMSTRPGGCKCFEYVKKYGLHAYLRKRRIPMGGQRLPVLEVISDAVVPLLSGLLCLNPDERLTTEESDRSVWSQAWLLEL